MALSAFASSITSIARAEYDALTGHVRGDPLLRDHIRTYSVDTGIPVTGPIDAFHYSAVFISWCIKRAGATKAEFAPVAAHWLYARRAIQNADSGKGSFYGLSIDSYAPRPGDLIDWSREGPIDFDRARSGHSYRGHGGIVVEIDGGASIAKIVVGNDEATGTVVMQDIALDDVAGLIVPRATQPFVCVIRTLL